MVYLGTYTQGKSEGIYSFSFDNVTGNTGPVELAAKLKTPSYIAISRNNQFLYSIMEIGSDSCKENMDGAVCAFSIDRKTGRLKLMNYHPTNSKVPSHVNVDRSNKYLFAANYKQGLVSVFSLNTDGSIDSLLSTIQHRGMSVNPDRQNAPHAHYVTLTPDEQYLCAVDLGIDKIVAYSFSGADGSMSPAQSLTTGINPGSGPRHMEFHPNNRFAYLINELSSDVVALEYSAEDARFTQLQYISALPAGYSGVSSGAAIHVSPDGNFLYTSNRGHNSIAAFKIDKFSGKLEFVSHTPTMGDFPRDFAIDPTGKFMIVANQNSSNAATYAINKESGELEQIGLISDIPNAICVKFTCL